MTTLRVARIEKKGPPRVFAGRRPEANCQRILRSLKAGDFREQSAAAWHFHLPGPAPRDTEYSALRRVRRPAGTARPRADVASQRIGHGLPNGPAVHKADSGNESTPAENP